MCGSKGHVASQVKHVKHFPSERRKTPEKDSLLSQIDSDESNTRMWVGLGKRKLSVRNEDLNVVITCLVIYHTVYLIIN